MKLWIDDVRPAPQGFIRCKSVNEAKFKIECSEKLLEVSSDKTEYKVEVIDIDHDAGEYAYDGGYYINLLDWLEETGRNYPIHIHSMNPVWVERMRRIIRKNGWTEASDEEVMAMSEDYNETRIRNEVTPEILEDATPKTDRPYESVMSYIYKTESEFYNKASSQSLESKLTTMYTLYMAAWAVGEISWNDAFYGYADFTAKLLNIR